MRAGVSDRVTGLRPAAQGGRQSLTKCSGVSASPAREETVSSLNQYKEARLSQGSCCM